MRAKILVASAMGGSYDALREAQVATWDFVAVDGVETRYYFSDSLRAMTGTLRAEIAEILFDDRWDLIFRTNASSYVDKRRLVARAVDLPLRQCYSGVDGGGFASGSGFFLSRDLAEILVRDLPEESDDADDVVVGKILAGVKILPGKRYDFWDQDFQRAFYGRGPVEDDPELFRAYHVRCKHGTDRGKDAEAMWRTHRLKLSHGLDLR